MLQVDLEPHGQLHVVIELHGSAVEGELLSSESSALYFPSDVLLWPEECECVCLCGCVKDVPLERDP